MDLSNDLISQFAKITAGNKDKNSETTVYGTVKIYDGKTCVKIDGSDLLTPVDTTTEVKEGQRVTVLIKNHSAVIMGNTSDPSASVSTTDGISENVTKITADIGEFKDLTAENFEATNATIENLTAKNAEIEELVAEKATIEDLNATNASIESLQAKDAEIEELVAEKATIEQLNAANANITNLQADVAEIDEALINKAEIKDLEAEQARIEELYAENAKINEALVNKADISLLDATWADIDSLEADVADIDTALIGKATIEELKAVDAKIDNLEVDQLRADVAALDKAIINKAEASDLKASQAEIVELQAKSVEIDEALINKASVSDLNATNANVTNLQADVAEIDEALIDKANVSDLNVTNANVTNLQADNVKINEALVGKATIEELEAVDAKIDNLEVDQLRADVAQIDEALINKANVADLNAANADIDILTGKVADIETLVGGNLTMDNIQSLNLTTGKVTVDDAFIKDAMIDSVTASKLTAGTIDTNQITVKSTDGSMILSGSVQQFKDENGTVRIQIGKDSGGNFSFILYDSTGKGVLIDEDGIKSSNAIADGLIVDSKVADNANISGSKLNIASVIQEVNNDNSTTIKSNKIYLDEQGQSLEVAFNSLKTQVETIQDVTIDGDLTSVIEQVQSNTTQINASKSDISTLMSENTLRKEEIQNLDGEIQEVNTSMNDKYTSLEQDLDGFKTTVSETYTTKSEFNNLEVGGRNLILDTKAFGGWDVNSAFTIQNGQYDGTFNAYYINYTDTTDYRDVRIKCVVLEPNTSYTLSFWAKGTGGFRCHLYDPNVVAHSINSCGYETTVFSDGRSDFTLTSSDRWIRYWVTWTTNSTINTTASKIACRVTSAIGPCEITLCGVKFEKGGKATDWTPAPEDVDASIASVSNNLLTNYSTTTQMNAAITQKSNEINSAVSETYATKTTVNNLSNNLTTNYSTTAQMNSAIDQKATSITNSVAETYATKTELDNLEVGGRNLIKNSAPTSTSGWAKSTGWDIALIDCSTAPYSKAIRVTANTAGITGGMHKPSIYSQDKTRFVDGADYTISVWMRASKSMPIKFMNELMNENIETVGTEWQYYSYACAADVTKSWASDVFYVRPDANIEVGDWFEVHSLKLEKGNKATDWTPAPEDVDDKIYSAESKIEQSTKDWTATFSASGGYNLLQNSSALLGVNRWHNYNLAQFDSYTDATIKKQTASGKTFRLGNNATTERYAFSYRFLLQPGKTYTISGKYYVGTNCTGIDVYLLTSNSITETGNVSPNSYDNAYQLVTDNTYSSGTYKSFKRTVTVGASCLTGVIRLDNNGSTVEGELRQAYFADLMITEGSLASPWSPHPNEVYSGITTIDAQGIKVEQTGYSGHTHMSANGFYVNDGTTDVVKITKDGAVFTGKMVVQSGSSVPASALTGSVTSSQLDSSVTSKLDNAYNRVVEWAYGAVSGSTTIDGGLIQTNTILADKIAANQITTKHLTLGDFENYCRLHESNSTALAWETYLSTTNTAYRWFRRQANHAKYPVARHNLTDWGDVWIPCRGGESLFIYGYIGTSLVGKTTSDGSGDDVTLPVGICITYILANGTQGYLHTARVTADSGDEIKYGTIKEYVTLPDTAKRMQVHVFVGGYKFTSGMLCVHNLTVRKMASSELIVDGAITAAKVSAGAITTDKLAANAVTAGKIAADAVTADKIKAGAVTAAKITITDFTNYCVYPYNSTMVNDKGQTVPAYNVNTINHVIISQDKMYGFVGGEQFRVKLKIRCGATADTVVINIAWRKSDQSYIGGTELKFAGTANSVTSHSGLLTLLARPSDAASCNIKIYTDNTSSGVKVSDVIITRMYNGELIVDGSITAGKIASNAVTTDKLNANAVTAAKLAANAVTADKISAGAIQAKHIAIGDFNNYSQLTKGQSITTNYGTAKWTQDATDATHCYWYTNDDYFPFTATGTPNPFGVGDTLQFKFEAYVSVAATKSVGVWFYSDTGSSSYLIGSSTNVSFTTGWNTYTVDVGPFTDNKVKQAKSIAILIQNGNNERLEIRNATIQRKVAGTLVVDGTITTDKLAANAVTAAKIAAGTITGSKIAANTINASKLAIGDMTNLCATDPVSNIYGATIKTLTDGSQYFQFGGKAWTRLDLNKCTSGNRTIKKGDVYRLSFAGYISNASASDIYFHIRSYYSDGSYVTLGTKAINLTTSYQEITTEVTIVNVPDGTKVVNSLNIYFETGNHTSTACVKNIVINKKANGELIVDGSITAAKIAANAVTADKIKAESITGSKIAAGTITANKLAVTDGTNYSQLTTNTATHYGWTKGTNTDYPYDNWFTRNSVARDNTISEWFPCKGGERLRVSGEIFTSVYGQTAQNGTATAVALEARIGIYTNNTDGTKSYLFSSAVTAASTSGTSGSVSNVITLPSNAREFGVRVQIAGWPTFSGTLRVRNIVVNKMASAELIVDGAVTAGKIAAGAITTDKLAANAVTAAKIAANAITADKIAAGAITADMIAGGTLSATDEIKFVGGARMFGNTGENNAGLTISASGYSFGGASQSYMYGHWDIENNLEVGGTLTVLGSSTLKALSATTISASSTLKVTGASTLAALSATTISASSTLKVTGASTLTGAVSTGTSLTVAGTLVLNNGSIWLGTRNETVTAANIKFGTGGYIAAYAGFHFVNSSGSPHSVYAGTMYTNGTTVTSDRRKKMDIRYVNVDTQSIGESGNMAPNTNITIQDMHDFIGSLPLTSFRYKDEVKDNRNLTHYGFLTQDIMYTKVGSELVAMLDERKHIGDEEDYTGYSVEKLLMFVCGALQEEIHQRQKLEKEIKNLKEGK